jgi:hypothetical protein
MSKKIILGFEQEQRIETATAVQNLLTEYGCHIKTRLGLHQTAEDSCSPKGLILLEMADHVDKEADELEKKLKEIKGIVVKRMEF